MGKEDARPSWFRLRTRRESQQLYLMMAKCRSSARLTPKNHTQRPLKMDQKNHIFLSFHLHDIVTHTKAQFWVTAGKSMVVLVVFFK